MQPANEGRTVASFACIIWTKKLAKALPWTWDVAILADVHPLALSRINARENLRWHGARALNMKYMIGEESDAFAAKGVYIFRWAS